MASSNELVRVAAQKRGLFVKDLPKGKICMTDVNGLSYTFNNGYVNTIRKSTNCVLRNKMATKVILGAEKIPVPTGFMLPVASKAAIKCFVQDMGYPVCIKPVSGKGGKGVFPSLNSEVSVDKALNFLENKTKYILLEESLTGFDARVITVAGKVVAASLRLPANVLGDGTNSIAQLIEDKVKLRLENKIQRARSLKIDHEVIHSLDMQGLTPESIVEAGVFVKLRNNSNLSTGGESVNITDKLSKSTIEAVEKAVSVFPDLVLCGVDVMFEKDPRYESSDFKVIELNRAPGIRGHYYPNEGDSIDVALLLVDSLFGVK